MLSTRRTQGSGLATREQLLELLELALGQLPQVDAARDLDRASAGAHSGPVDWDNPAAVDARAQAFVRQRMKYSDALTYMREQEAAPITGDGVISESAELDSRVVAHMHARHELRPVRRGGRSRRRR
jgi:hypothetical protein